MQKQSKTSDHIWLVFTCIREQLTSLTKQQDLILASNG